MMTKHKIFTNPAPWVTSGVFAVGMAASHATTVFTSDFSTIPGNLDITGGDTPYSQRAFDHVGTGVVDEGNADIDVTALGLSGQWLFTPTAGVHRAVLTLNGLDAHDFLDIGFFLNAGGGLDGAFGGQDDSVEVLVDGVSIFKGNFGGRSPDRPGYGDTPEGQAAAVIRKLGEGEAPSSNLNDYRAGAWGHDALYDMSLEPSLQGIPHTASDATIEFITNRSEADGDEYFGLANLSVETSVIPEPSTGALAGLAFLTFLGIGRRRRS